MELKAAAAKADAKGRALLELLDKLERDEADLSAGEYDLAKWEMRDALDALRSAT